jgi:uncharacterized protein
MTWRSIVLYVIWLCAASLPSGIETRAELRASVNSPLLTVTYPNGSRIQVELADTNERRALGLMFREQLPKDRGMLFVFNEPGQWAFWMKNTTIPLDILWLDHHKKIVDLVENVPGCKGDPCLQYQPAQDASYALEIPGGSAKREKLAKGMQLSFDLPKR